MHEESDVSKRHMKNAWWIRMDGGPHMRTARGRRRIWRAARRAADQVRDDDRVEDPELCRRGRGGEMGKKEMGAREKQKRRKQHLAHSLLLASNNHSNSNNHDRGSSSRNGSCSRSNALAMNDALMSVVEKTTTDVLKLKELDKIVVKLHCGDREKNHQSRRGLSLLVQLCGLSDRPVVVCLLVAFFTSDGEEQCLCLHQYHLCSVRVDSACKSDWICVPSGTRDAE